MAFEYSQQQLANIVRQFELSPHYKLKLSIDGDIVLHGNGHINSTYLVRLVDAETNRKYCKILQKINTSIFKDVYKLTENIKCVCDHLRSKGICTLQMASLTRAPSAHIFHDVDTDSYWRMFDYILNSRSIGDVPSSEEAFAAAKEYGKFQSALSDLPISALHDTIPDFHNTRMRYDNLMVAVVEDICGRVKCHGDVWKELEPFIRAREGLADALTNLHSLQGVPLRVVHNDTKLNNVLLDVESGKGVCVVDLDTVMPGLTLYDFGDMVRTAANTRDEDEPDSSRVDIDLTLFEAVAAGYLQSDMLSAPLKAIGLLPVELDHLVTAAKVITFEQGIRFLTDFFNGDVYYGTDPAREGMHNLHRAQCQFAYLRRMEEQEESMQRIVERIVEEKRAHCGGLS